MRVDAEGENIIYYGGSFNPPHIGHMRLAIETLQAFRWLDPELAILPSFQPPHKKASQLLPFALRVGMITEAIKNLPRISCSEIEASLIPPSYSWNTLCALHDFHPGTKIFFLMGSHDFTMLDTWKNGLDLPQICSLVIAPRGEYGEAEFYRQCQTWWPGGRICEQSRDEFDSARIMQYTCRNMHPIYLEYIHYIDLSSTLIRELWLAGRNIEFLVPEGTGRLMRSESGLIRSIWRENDKKC